MLVFPALGRFFYQRGYKGGFWRASEAQLYRLLCGASWRPTIVSVGHRSTLRNFHNQVVELADFTVNPDERLEVSKASQFAS